MLRRALLLALALFVAIGVRDVRGDFLAEYLKDKTFGRRGGNENDSPCPPGNPCIGSFKNLPDSVKAIRVCLLFNTLACGRLDELIQSGDYTISNLVCKRVSLQDLNFNSGTFSFLPASLIGQIQLRNLRLSCEFDMDMDQLVLELVSFFKFTMSWSDSRLDFSQDFGDDGTNADLSAIFTWANAGARSTEVPDNVTIAGCDIDPDLGLTLDLKEDEFDYLEICAGFFGCARQTDLIWGLIFRLVNWSAVIGALVNIFEGLIGSIVCQIFEEAGFLENGQPGILNEIWYEVRADFEQAASAVPDDLRDEDSDAVQLSRWSYIGVNQTMLDNAIDFSNSTTAEVISVTLNNWLGSKTTTDIENPDRLVVNEVVDSLTDPNGYFLSGSLIGNDLLYEGEGGISYVTIRLDELQLFGLNTFEVFRVLQNGYEDNEGGTRDFDAYRRTFNNTIEMETLGLQVKVYVKLSRGAWVAESCVELESCAPRPDDSSEFTFTYSMVLREVALEAALAVVLNDNEWNNLRVGQLTQYDRYGDSVDLIQYWAEQCLAAAFYTMRFSSISGSVAEIDDPQVINFEGDGLTDFVQGVADFVAEAIKGATKAKFPGLAQGPLREYFNNATREWVEIGRLRGVRNCPRWTPTGVDLLEVDFDEGVASYVYPLINDALGGDPIPNTDSDINEIVETLLKFYELKDPELFIDSWDNTTDPATPFPQGYWEPKDEYQESAKLPAFQDDTRFLWFTNFYASGVNSIYKLTADKVPEVENFDRGMRVKASVGGAMRNRDPTQGLEPPNPLVIGWTFQVQDALRGVDETWSFDLNMEALDLEFIVDNVIWNVNRAYSLTYNKTGYLPCILYALNNIGFPQVGRIVNLQRLDVDIAEVDSSSTLPSDVRDALLALAADTLITNPADPNYNSPEQVTRRKTARRFKGLINSYAAGLLNYGLDELEDLPERYIEEGVTAQNCPELEDPFAGPKSLGALTPPNLTYFEDVCLGPIEPFPDPTTALDRVTGYDEDAGDPVFNFETNEAFKILRELFENGDRVNNILIGLANTTDGSFAQYLKLDDSDPGNIRVDLELPLEKLGFFYESDRVLPGFIADGGILYMEGINRFFRSESTTDDYKLLFPVNDGAVVLKNKFLFTEDTPLNTRIVSLVTVPAELANDTNAQPGELIQEQIELELVINGLELEFDLVLAINEDLFGNLTLAHFFRYAANQTFYLQDWWSDCLFSTVYEDGVLLNFLDVNITNMTGPTLATTQEFISPGVETFLQAMVDIMKDFYFAAIPNICQNCLRTFINDELRLNWEAAQEGTCPPLEFIPLEDLPEENQYYRFDEAEDWLALQQFMRDFVAGDDNSYSDFNEVVEAAFATGFFREDEDADILLRDVPLLYDNTQYGIGGFALRNMRVVKPDPLGPGGIGSVVELRLLEPYDIVDLPEEIERRRRRLEDINLTDAPAAIEDMPFTTLTQLRVAGPVRIEAYYELNLTDVFPEVPNMVNQLEIAFTFRDLFLRLVLMMKVDVKVAMTTRFSSISTADELPCLFVPVDELVPLEFNFTTQDLEIRIECRGQCDLFRKYNIESVGVIDSSSVPQLSEYLNDFIAFWVSYVDSRGAQTAIDAFLGSAEEQCARVLGLLDGATDVPVSQSAMITITFGIVFAGGLGLGAGFAAMLFPAHKKRRQRLMAIVLGRYKDVSSEEELAGIMAITELSMRSTFSHPVTPVAAKFIVPIICALNIVGLVVAVIFSDAANIVIIFTLFGIRSRQIALVPFTILSTINQIWDSGAYPLAMLIATASVAWPVVKNFLLIAIWFMPKTLMRAKRQRRWLDVMDILGKWSALDIFVIVLMLAALRTYVSASYFSFGATLDEDFFLADVTVTAERGLILLSIVTAFSMIMNTVIVLYHERVQTSNAVSEDKINGNYIGKIPQRAARKRRIMQHIFVGKDSDGRVRRVSVKASVALLVTAAISFILTIVGVTYKFVTFKLSGLVGILLEYIYENGPKDRFETQLNIKSYSVIELGAGIQEAPNETAGDAFSIFIFQFLYFLIMLVAPLLSIITCAVMVAMPLDLFGLRRFLFYNNLAYYWAAIEVFTVGLLITITQLELITAEIVDYITNDVCGYVQGAIGLLVEDPEDAFCLNTTATFEASSALLIISTILHQFIFFSAATVSRAVADDRYFAAYHDLRNDVKPKRLNRVERLLLRLFTNTFPADDTGNDERAAFYNLDGSNFDDQVEEERGACDKVWDWLCSTEKGNQAADARIEAWQKRFGVGQPHMSTATGASGLAPMSTRSGAPPSVSAPNPVFMAPSSTSARVRSGSEDSVDV